MPARYYRELLNHFTHAVRDRDHAADVVQEAYSRVLTLQRTGQAVHEPRALLYRIARNLLVDHHRRRQVRAETVVEEPAAIEDVAAPPALQPEAAASSAQGVQALLATIDALPLRCREAFVLHKFDGLSHVEVAARMGISRKAVEQHLKLALQACRRCRDGEDMPPRR